MKVVMAPIFVQGHPYQDGTAFPEQGWGPLQPSLCPVQQCRKPGDQHR